MEMKAALDILLTQEIPWLPASSFHVTGREAGRQKGKTNRVPESWRENGSEAQVWSQDFVDDKDSEK